MARTSYQNKPDGAGDVVDIEVGDGELRQVNFRVPEAVLDGLRRLADLTDMSVPQLVAHEMTGYYLRERQAVKEAVAEQAERARLRAEQLEHQMALVAQQHEARAARLAGLRLKGTTPETLMTGAEQRPRQARTR